MAINIWKRVNEAKDNRHIADYLPYNTQRNLKDRYLIAITGGDWFLAANFNIQLAEILAKAAAKFIGL